MAIWGALIGAAASLANSAINRKNSFDAMSKQYQYNEMAAKSNDERVRNLYNDFQSPMAKKNQLEKAGFNPALIYQGLQGNIGSAGTNSGVSAVNTPVEGIGNPVQTYMDMKLNQKQIELLDAEIRNKDADTKNKDADTGNKLVENEVIQKTLEKMDAEIDLMKNQTKLTDAQIEQIKKANEKMCQEIDVMVKQMEEIDTNINKTELESKIIEYQRNYLLPAQKALIDWQSGKREIEIFGKKYNSQEFELMKSDIYWGLVGGVESIAKLIGIDNIKNAFEGVKSTIGGWIDSIGKTFDKFFKWWK